MSLAVVHTALHSAALRGRFEAAAVAAAGAIIAEDAGTTNHAARLAWAEQVIGVAGADAPGYTTASAARMVRYALGTNGTAQTLGDDLTDSDIEFIVASILGSESALEVVD
jgi:hypothetical protein